MWFLLILLPVMADEPPGFELLSVEGGCRFSRSAPDPAGYPILRAECVWSDVSPAQLNATLGDWGAHQDIWSMVSSSRVVERRADGARVVHVHEAPVMVDREVLLRMWVEQMPAGQSYRWTLAQPQPDPAEGRVGVELDDGAYTVVAEGDGSRLISTLHYDPGGSIPAALVRWFQVLGMPRFLEELKLAAMGVDLDSD